MALFTKIIFWVIGLMFYVGLAIYCFDSSNSDGNRAVAAMVACLFYVRHEFVQQEARHDQLLARIGGLEEAASRSSIQSQNFEE